LIFATTPEEKIGLATGHSPTDKKPRRSFAQAVIRASSNAIAADAKREGIYRSKNDSEDTPL
jgi:hypothetical protein